jgi:hypothetical protein
MYGAISNNKFIGTILTLFSFFVAEDISTPICGKEEESCAKLARSECSNAFST